MDDETEGQPPKKKLKESTESLGLFIITGNTPDAADNSILETQSKQLDWNDWYDPPMKKDLIKNLKGFFYGEKCKADKERSEMITYKSVNHCRF